MLGKELQHYKDTIRVIDYGYETKSLRAALFLRKIKFEIWDTEHEDAPALDFMDTTFDIPDRRYEANIEYVEYPSGDTSLEMHVDGLTAEQVTFLTVVVSNIDRLA